MFAMLNNLYATLSVFFTALMRGSSAVDKIMMIGDEAATSLLIESRVERQAKLKKLATKLGIEEEELAKLSKVESIFDKDDD